MELWIARDDYGLWLYEEKPTKRIVNNDKFFPATLIRYEISPRLFKNVTWENSPQKVKIDLV